MIDIDKKEFMLMMRIVCSSFNHKEFDKETLRYWFSKLEPHDIKTVSGAFDRWIDGSKFMPTIKDILDACKPVTPIYTALARKSSREAGKQYAENVVKFVAENTKSKTNYRAWIKPILANPKAYPDISFKFAKEVESMA